MKPKELLTWGIATSLVLNACNAKATPTIDLVVGGQDLNTPTPEFTPTPIPPTPTDTAIPTATLDFFSSEVLENSKLGTPMAIYTEIAATQAAINWEVLANEGFPEKAIYSSALIIDSGEYKQFMGSANLLHIPGWWVVLTAGHFLTGKTNNIILNLIRQSMPNEGAAFFYNVGSAHILEPDGRDFGVMVIPDEVIENHFGKDFGGLFPAEKVLSWEDLNFSDPGIDKALSGVCFPGSFNPTIVNQGQIFMTDKTNHVLDNALVAEGCSGGGLFDFSGKYVGPVIAGITQHLLALNSPFYYDDAWISSLYSIGGEEGLKVLIKQAQDNFLGK